jgi:glycosyltransferase involved in cell wall biosynthesis
MKSWQVSDARWASRSELDLPLWQELGGGWRRPYVASRVPRGDSSGRYAASVDGLDAAADALAALRELLDSARHRVALTLEVGDGDRGLERKRLRELEELVGAPLPRTPPDALVTGDRRTLGLTLDATDGPRSTAILVPHWESWQFLEPCIDAITHHRNPRVAERVYVLDDFSTDGSYEKALEAYGDRDDVRVLRIDRPNRASVADVGMLLDLGLREVEEQYVVTIDADLFPLSDDWLAFPIWLIEKFGCSAAGLDTGLSTGYAPREPERDWWQPQTGYIPSGGLYENDWFVCINNLYRAMPTALALVASEQVGFARRTGQYSLPRKGLRRAARSMPAALRRPRRGRRAYISHDADNGVAANHFLDVNRLGPKFNIPITSYLGLTRADGAFGQNISGLAFHFALSTRALSRERREIEEPGPEFTRWAERLSAAGGVDRALLDEMIEDSYVARPGGQNGEIPASWYEAEFEYMQRVLERYRADPL